MTTDLLKSMIAHYKETGSRVDEVLFQEVMKVVGQVKELDDAAYGLSETLRQELGHSVKLSGRIESAEAVINFYANPTIYDLQSGKGGTLFVEIERDKGRRARTYLGRENSEDKKTKGAARNR